MVNRKEVEEAFERIKELTKTPTLKMDYNSAWRGYNITLPNGDHPFGMEAFKGETIIAAVRFIKGCRNLV